MDKWIDITTSIGLSVIMIIDAVIIIIFLLVLPDHSGFLIVFRVFALVGWALVITSQLVIIMIRKRLND